MPQIGLDTGLGIFYLLQMLALPKREGILILQEYNVELNSSPV